MYKCPKDPKLNYYNRFCKEMQRSTVRVWCSECPHFHKVKKKGRVKKKK